MTRKWAFLLCVKREGGFIFSVIRESIFFRPRETGFRLFRDPWNMHLLSRDLWTNDFFGNNFFTFLQILASLELVNYTKLDVEPAYSMRLWMKNWSRTNHSDSELGGPRICIHGLEFWDKFALPAFVAHVRREYNLNCLVSPPNFCWFSTLYWRGEVKIDPYLKGKQRFFQTSVLNTDNSLNYVNVPRTFGHDCLIFTSHGKMHN